MTTVNYAATQMPQIREIQHVPGMKGKSELSAATPADYQQQPPDSEQKNTHRPALAPPKNSFTPANAEEDMSKQLMQISELNQKLSHQLAAIIGADIRANHDKAKHENAEVVENMLATIEKLAEERALSRSNFFLGLLGKIAGVVVAIVAAVATVATAGAAAPLLVLSIAGATYLTADAGLDVASEISGEDVHMGTLIAKAIEEAALAAGNSAEEAKEIALWAGMAIQLVLTVAASVASGAGLSSAIAAGTQSGAKLLQLVQRGAQIIHITSGIASGGVRTAVAFNQKGQAELNALLLELQGLIQMLQMMMDEDQDLMKLILEHGQSTHQIAAGILDEQHASYTRIAA